MRHDAPKADFPNLKQNRVGHASDIQKALIDWLVTHYLTTYGSFLESIPVISPAIAGEGKPARTDRTRSFVCSSFASVTCSDRLLTEKSFVFPSNLVVLCQSLVTTVTTRSSTHLGRKCLLWVTFCVESPRNLSGLRMNLLPRQQTHPTTDGSHLPCPHISGYSEPIAWAALPL